MRQALSYVGTFLSGVLVGILIRRRLKQWFRKVEHVLLILVALAIVIAVPLVAVLCWPEHGGNLAVAWGTLFLGFVAAFEPGLRNILFGPKLRIHEAGRQGDDWLLRVSNKGRGTARKVEVHVLRLVRERDDGPVLPDVIFPRNLFWTARTKHQRTLPVLGRDVEWLCRVLRAPVKDDAGSEKWKVEECRFATEKGEEGKDTKSKLCPGVYLLSVQVTADRQTPVPATFRVTYQNCEFPTEDDAKEKAVTLVRVESSS